MKLRAAGALSIDGFRAERAQTTAGAPPIYRIGSPLRTCGTPFFIQSISGPPFR